MDLDVPVVRLNLQRDIKDGDRFYWQGSIVRVTKIFKTVLYVTDERGVEYTFDRRTGRVKWIDGLGTSFLQVITPEVEALQRMATKDGELADAAGILFSGNSQDMTTDDVLTTRAEGLRELRRVTGEWEAELERCRSALRGESE